MKKQTLNQALVLLLSTVSLLGTVACSSQSSNNGGTVTTTSYTVGAGYNASGQALTNCSHDVAGLPDFSMSLENYTLNGNQYTNWIRVHFNLMPASYSANSNALITFWAYGTDSVGNFTGMTPVEFFLESTSGTQISQPTYSLTWAQFSTYATSPLSVNFVVQLDQAPYSTVLSAALYNNGVGTGPYLASADRALQGLIPTFLASPNDYALNHNQTLLSLHPLRSQLNSGQSEAQYEALAQTMCFF